VLTDDDDNDDEDSLQVISSTEDASMEAASLPQVAATSLLTSHLPGLLSETTSDGKSLVTKVAILLGFALTYCSGSFGSVCPACGSRS
jgi:hypothetical protein